MGNAQGLDVVQAGGLTGGICGALLNEAQELARLGDAGAGIGTQVPDMELIDHRIGDVAGQVGRRILGPIHGVRGAKVEDHGPLAVDAGGPGVGVAGLHDCVAVGHCIGIVGAVQVPLHGGHPGAVCVGSHGNGIKHGIQSSLPAVFIQVNGNSVGSGSPDPEGGLLGGPGGTQIVVFVGVLILEIGGGVPNGHSDFLALCAVGQGIGDGHVDGLGGDDGVDVLLALDHLGDGQRPLGTGDTEGGGVADGTRHGGPEAQGLGIGGVPDADILVCTCRRKQTHSQKHRQCKGQHPCQISFHRALSLFVFGRKCRHASIIL